jgi:hypothetical protein
VTEPDAKRSLTTARAPSADVYSVSSQYICVHGNRADGNCVWHKGNTIEIYGKRTSTSPDAPRLARRMA